eukprot:4913372-Ditylum_brightwellii.AAC.1
MENYKYINIPMELIPEEIIEQYNLKVITYNSNVYIKVQKGVYRLPQAGCISHDQMVAHLQKYSYTPCKFTP